MQLKRRVIQHRIAPAGISDEPRENRRPHRAGEISAARNQSQRRAAAAVEPAADIDVTRRVDAADADQADEQAVPDIKRPGRPQRRQSQPDGDHRSAEDDGEAYADMLGNATHQDAAEAGADPHQGAGEGRNRALAVDLGGDVLQRDHGDPWRAERDRHDRKNDAWRPAMRSASRPMAVTADCSMSIAVLTRPAGCGGGRHGIAAGGLHRTEKRRRFRLICQSIAHSPSRPMSISRPGGCLHQALKFSRRTVMELEPIDFDALGNGRRGGLPLFAP